MDEARFAQYGSRCRMWVPPEVGDPVLLHYPTRKSVGYWGALRLHTGALVTCRETESFDGRTSLHFLQQLNRCARRPGRQVFVIAANAAFH